MNSQIPSPLGSNCEGWGGGWANYLLWEISKKYPPQKAVVRIFTEASSNTKLTHPSLLFFAADKEQGSSTAEPQL